MGSHSEQRLYLEGGAFACFHPTPTAGARDTAVILCPPFGWDEICSYRVRREWAQQLSAAGYSAVRISYPSTGDSAGMPADPARLDAWTQAVTNAASWIRHRAHARRVVAVGMELGGLLAWRSAARGSEVDDLVLWATPATGKVLVRQLRAFAAMELSKFFEGLEPPPPPQPDELHAGGFSMSAETVGALTKLNLPTLSLPGAAKRRVLLLERDGIRPDKALHSHLEQAGAAVTIGAGPGYGAMTSHPQQARAPLEVMERVTAWLDAASEELRPDAGRAGSDDDQPPTLLDAGVKETPLELEYRGVALRGVLAEPLQPHSRDLCAVMFNAGAVRQIGPNRIWVEAARRWARWGISVVRIDLEGLGDADGDPSRYRDDAGLYAPELVDQALAVVEELHEQGLGRRFVLAGLCGGAYWSLHAGLESPHVAAALMLNPRALQWDHALPAARDFRALRSQHLTLSKLREQASFKRVWALTRWLVSAPKRWLLRLAGASDAAEPTDQLLERLRASDLRALFVFAEHEPLRDELVQSGALERLAAWDNVTIEFIPVRDHTLRPKQAQRQAHDALDRALQRELAAAGMAATSLTA